MNVATIEMSRGKAREAFKAYKRAVADRGTAQEKEILAGYRQLAMGRTVISLVSTFQQTGTDVHGRPRLAIAAADAAWCWFEPRAFQKDSNDGWRHMMCRFTSDTRRNPHNVPYTGRNESRTRIAFAASVFGNALRGPIKAQVPLIPPKHRPRWSLRNYHILFDADWAAPPKDPLLVRRIGRDLCVVLAAWDLTELERSVLGASAFSW